MQCMNVIISEQKLSDKIKHYVIVKYNGIDMEELLKIIILQFFYVT